MGLGPTRGEEETKEQMSGTTIRETVLVRLVR